MINIDRLFETQLRGLAKRTSRRSLLGRLGTVIAAGSTLPLLPIARGAAAESSPDKNNYGLPSESSGNAQDPGDINSCDYWRYCAIDGFLCNCCGGSPSKCPPGAEMAVLTWIGTCRNPADNRNYILSYNDCCGISSCGRCLCNRNENERPIVRPQANNDTNWCTGTSSTAYVCSTAVVIGVATAQ